MVLGAVGLGVLVPSRAAELLLPAAELLQQQQRMECSGAVML